ncbi:helix-turn-helix domain-containing protein [Lactiplantibacillus mudanjiangensis]|uniref:Transcriptional regulator [Lactobacillus rhamnosus] n=1 Tax=Lactiplantibacillus mudanjiangensis TaxID=1296538 RepID=A0A660DZ59_9LACO|nr:helix-turn-helix transcriptional regulator [Lactiplantibacillus mudanjiangensis]VDG21034.1 transcriptional regulator [Lactobacillus rhamnosus] [Lactiplantibacillus mudanjiangensis]VDG26053.1 transcriptional regulator [Lactobacillus rhamnosus] [Lactiplantibacillus mudanjiangensis]VDG29109.1 transcriptional regulator [Lactobacillus rhamnosus] [Lactiplantibacillus mudanjiangensis]VDG31629.1 transcriptional regulator [Lactobacillus rhamnosus] [Lactiplantibacillus mudanjiangensis]
MTSIKFNDYLQESLKNPSFKASYNSDYSKLASAAALMKARETAGLTQQELAVKASVPQSTVARIESGANTSFDTLSKIAFALGKRLIVDFS